MILCMFQNIFNVQCNYLCSSGKFVHSHNKMRCWGFSIILKQFGRLFICCANILVKYCVGPTFVRHDLKVLAIFISLEKLIFKHCVISYVTIFSSNRSHFKIACPYKTSLYRFILEESEVK